MIDTSDLETAIDGLIEHELSVDPEFQQRRDGYQGVARTELLTNWGFDVGDRAALEGLFVGAAIALGHASNFCGVTMTHGSHRRYLELADASLTLLRDMRAMELAAAAWVETEGDPT